MSAQVSYFDSIVKSYVDVPTENGIEVVSFLEATESLVSLFDLLHATAFAPVKSDMNGNVAKIRKKYLENPTEYTTLQKIVESEVGLGSKRVATQGLLWLKRGLRFICEALKQNSSRPTEELSVSFNEAYARTLKKYHSFLIAPIFSLAMKACPYRVDFYKKLGPDPVKVQVELKDWLEALDKIVNTLDEFYAQGNHEKGL
ncbi:hypothetical protein K502DRAFT_322568 [Neoconidiobolus thromboides FSU 785]|nr:hypothetical protein K502DRAFT_322568 [Neoconidiobolus thromboides FSU 785]